MNLLPENNPVGISLFIPYTDWHQCGEVGRYPNEEFLKYSLEQLLNYSFK